MDLVDALAGMEIHSKEGHDLWVLFVVLGAFFLLHLFAGTFSSQSSEGSKSRSEVQGNSSSSTVFRDTSTKYISSMGDRPESLDQTSLVSSSSRLTSRKARSRGNKTADRNRIQAPKRPDNLHKKKQGSKANGFNPELFLPEMDADEGWFGGLDGTKASAVRLCVAYEDGKHQKSKRVITVHRFRETETGMILSAFCHQRLTTLTFRVDRILEAWNPDNGDEITEIESYIQQHSS